MSKIFHRLLQNFNKLMFFKNNRHPFLPTNKVILFKDNFEVVDIDDLVMLKKSRILLRKENHLSLYSNNLSSEIKKDQQENVIFFEIIYSREKLYSFLVYHTTSKPMAEEYFKYFHITLNNLNRSISLIKITAMEQLKSIMATLKINPRWSSTHVASRIGMEVHFKESREIAMNEINTQMEEDLMTPLHLAIHHRWPIIVKTILDLFPNLNLVDSKQYSVLHSAALSTHEIFCLILHQPNMFDRILWRNHQGSTALHLACFAQNYNIVFEFLKFGLTVRMLTLAPPKICTSKINVTSAKGKKSSTINSITNQSKLLYKKNKRENKIYDQIVSFTEQDLCDIDCQDIVMAGSPLHWVKHRRLMEKLIAYKFRLHTPNMNEDTPLHVMVKRNRLRCLITLLCSGAQVNARNKFGNTPLHNAVKIGEITLAQTLIVFDADIDSVNYMNESVRHLAAKESPFSQQILFLLSSLGAKRCSKDQLKNCKAGCIADGNFEGKWVPTLNELTKHYESLFQNIKNRQIFEQEINKNVPTNDEDQSRKRDVNILALDGGGIKGLITIQVLIELQKYLDRPIIDYFQWIAGTSTGSFIATYLVMGKTLRQIRSIYIQFKDKVFIGERPYDSEILEKLVKETVGSDLKMEDLKTRYNKMVMFPAGLFDRIPMKLHLFRSYESHYELLKISDSDHGFSRQPSREQLVWKACRASGSAPTYFKSFGPFIDGGLIACNPTLDVLTEFEFRNMALKHVGREEECQNLKFILSLGTGRQRVEESKAIDISAFSIRLMELNNQIRYMCQMASLLLSEICNTDNHVVNRAEAFCSATNILYFRINPIFNKLIELDETLDFKIVNCLWETKRFMYLKRNEIQRIAEYLKKFTYFPTEDNTNSHGSGQKKLKTKFTE